MIAILSPFVVLAFVALTALPCPAAAETEAEAERLHHEAFALEERALSKKELARMAKTKADVQQKESAKADLEKALSLYQQALRIYEQLHITLQVANVNGSIGGIRFILGDYPKALSSYQEALDAALTLEDEMSQNRSRALNGLGLVSTKLGKYDRAVSYYQQALDLGRKGVGQRQHDREDEAAALNNIGLVYLEAGRYDEAEKMLREALNVCDEVGKRPEFRALAEEWSARVKGNLGTVHMLRGEYPAAEELFKQAKCIRDRAEVENIDGTLYTLPTLAELYSYWGQRDEALRLYKEALGVSEQLGYKQRTGELLLLKGRLLQQRAETYVQALSDFQEARRLYEEMTVPTIEPKTLEASLHLTMGKLAKAEPLLRDLEVEYRTTPKKSALWSLKARFHLAKSEYGSANRMYHELLKSAKSNKDADMIFTAYTGLGVTYEKLDQLSNAETWYQRAVDFTEGLRTSLAHEQRRRFFGVTIEGFERITPYKGLSRVLFRLSKFEDAFKISDFGKARVFAEAMAKSTEEGRKTRLTGVDDRVKRLLDRMAQLKKKRTEALEDADIVPVSSAHENPVRNHEKQVKEVEAEWQSFKTALREDHPLLAAAMYPEPLDLIHTRLQSHEMALTYDVSDSGLLIYLTRGTKLLIPPVFKPVPRTELERLIEAFRRPLNIIPPEGMIDKRERREHQKNQLRSFDFRAGKRLADLLVGDVLAPGLLPAGEPLMIVPDGPLGELPFEMLVLNEEGKAEIVEEVAYIDSKKKTRWYGSVSGAQFFGDRNPVWYCQSMQALNLARAAHVERNPESKLLAIADTVFGSSDSKCETGGLRPMMSMEEEKLPYIPFRRLCETSDLAKKVAKLYENRAKLLLTRDATKMNVLKLMPELADFDAILFGTHGSYSAPIQGVKEPVLLMSYLPPDHDHVLSMSEVLVMKLRADIVALTACESGMGERLAGEGVMGMGRAFQWAGAQSVLMSLWSVDQTASCDLVYRFFHHLKAGESKWRALKQARAELRQDKRFTHPFSWAGFILVGEGE